MNRWLLEMFVKNPVLGMHFTNSISSGFKSHNIDAYSQCGCAHHHSQPIFIGQIEYAKNDTGIDRNNSKYLGIHTNTSSFKVISYGSTNIFIA